MTTLDLLKCNTREEVLWYSYKKYTLKLMFLNDCVGIIYDLYGKSWYSIFNPSEGAIYQKTHLEKKL